MSEPTENEEHPSPAKGGPSLVKTAAFAAILVVVVGLFYFLSTLDAPPNLPRDDVHKLRFNNDSELIGLGPGELPTVDAAGNTLSLEKKAIEKRVNLQCASCHGAPGLDMTTHACNQLSGRCIPEHHPPKETCIKCHRMGPSR